MRTTKAELLELKQEFETELEKLKAANQRYENSQQHSTALSQWHTQADGLSDEIIAWHNTAAEQIKAIATLANQAETDKPELDKYKSELTTMIAQFNTQKAEIQEIIDDANRASMAGSFKTQQDEMNKKMKWADGFLIVSLMITAIISLWGFKTSIIPTENGITHFDWVQFFAKSAISLPFLIVAWIKAKERAYLFRLREDYAYKYSAAMAFEGYRKQAKEQSPELEEKLLQIAINNLGANPNKVFDKDLKSTPLDTLIDAVGKRFDKGLEAVTKKTNGEENV